MKPPLRIAILECDTPLPQTDEEYHGYGGVFTALLQAGADALDHPGLSSKEGLDITKFNVEHEERYPKLDDIDAILLTGSSRFSSHLPSRLRRAICMGYKVDYMMQNTTPSTMHPGSSNLSNIRKRSSHRTVSVSSAYALGIR